MADENVCTVSNKFTTTSIINEPRLLKVVLWKKIRMRTVVQSRCSQVQSHCSQVQSHCAKFRVIAAKYIWFRVIGDTRPVQILCA
ncbi:hypothetical protein EMCRGX_G005651 [Ephydatia muelleri]